MAAPLAITPLAAYPSGFAKGLGVIVTREPAGIYPFVTAPFPLPAGF
ncbi:MAG: hypothetical protein M0R33_14685 [Methylomonas sp.]|nr:hypothetical protein [Methylomonas sp.]MCK9607685.1 hypothetical protein [Methylomonas sp.]